MGYVVRHSTSNVNKTRRRGKVAIGTDSSGYQKTSVSGLYNGVPPVEGKHNIVRVQSSGDPDFYALDDNEIINLANQLGGSTKTVLEAQNYLLGRDDIVFTDNIATKNVVTDGLVLNLDAKVKSSFLDNEPITNILDGGENRIKGITGAFNQGNHAGANSTEYVNQYYSEDRPDVIRIKTTNSTGYAMINQRMSSNAVSGSTYSYSFDYKQLAYDGTWVPTVGVYGDGYKVPNSSYTNVNTSYQYIPLSDGWTRFIVTYDATYAGRNTFRSNMNTNNNANLDILFDNFQIEEGSGTTFTTGSRSQNTEWKDLSGNSNDGTLTNGASFNSNTKSITLDGTNDYVLTTWKAPAGNKSMNFLVKYNSLDASGGNGYSLTGAQQVNAYFYTGIQDGGQGYSYAGNTGGTYNYYFSSSQWYNVSTVMDNGVTRHYVNGEQVATRNYTTSNASTVNFPIGCVHNGSVYQHFFDADFADMRVYNKVLSQSEINQNYYGGDIITNGLVFATDAGNLVSYESGSTITYSLTGSNSGSLINGVSYDSNNGGVFTFDGTDEYIRINANAALGTSQITVAAWVYPTQDATTGARTRGAVFGGPGALYLGLWPNSSAGSSAIHTAVQTTSGRPSTQTGTIYTNQWSYLLATYDGANFKTYLNGEYITQTSQTGNISAGSTYYIGTYSALTDGNHNFPGKISCATIYNRALTHSEVLQNYNAQKARFI